MEEDKSRAVFAGVIVGAAVVAAAIAIYFARSHGSRAADINDVLQKARSTVHQLDDALESLKKSAGAA